MENKIKWSKLVSISKEITGKDVSINLSTEKSIRNFFALANISRYKITIYINGNKCKSEQDVIKAIAHELAHDTANTTNDSEDHRKEWERLEEVIKSKY